MKTENFHAKTRNMLRIAQALKSRQICLSYIPDITLLTSSHTECDVTDDYYYVNRKWEMKRVISLLLT